MDDSNRPVKRSDLAARAARTAAELESCGQRLNPVTARGRNLVKSFWARAWMKHLAGCEIYGMRLSPGRSYLRNGCVIDLSVSSGAIKALVAGERLYEINIDIAPPDDEQLNHIRQRAGLDLSSWVDILQGNLSESVLDILCEPESGILPEWGNMRCSCTCPDWADLCKHAAAALYAAGVKIDSEPELLFILRHIRLADLIPRPDVDDQSQQTDKPAGDLSSIFGIDIEER